MILKTLKTTEFTIRSGKCRVGISSDSRARYNCRCKLGESEIDDSKVDNGEVRNDKVGPKDQKTFKCKNLFKSKRLSKSKKIDVLGYAINKIFS